MTPALALFLREWRIARRIGGGASVGAVFFLILVAIMPFALGPDLNLLARLGPAILWIAALLATLLGLDRLFQADHDDGSLDVIVNGSLPLELVVLVKCAAHWTTSALPLIVVSPIFGLMLAMAPKPLALVAATLAAGTPALTMIGAIGAALTVSLAARRAPDGGAGAAADHPGADLRRRGGVRRQRRRGAVPDAVPDALRDVALCDRRRAVRGGGGAAACEGVGQDSALHRNGFSTRSPSPIRMPCCMSCDHSRAQPFSAAAAAIIES